MISASHVSLIIIISRLFQRVFKAANTGTLKRCNVLISVSIGCRHTFRCVARAVFTFTGCARKSFSEEMTHLYFSSTKAILCVRSLLIELRIDYQITEMSLMAKCENEMRSLADLILVTGGNVTSPTN